MAIIVGFIALAILVGMGIFVFAAMQSRQGGSARGDSAAADPGGSLEELVCQNCGGELSREHFVERSGVTRISCPYCGSEYRMQA